jgi:hypothetical protein
MIDDLKRFTDVAEKNRKYAPNTATGIRVALGLFEAELNDQEKESLQTFKENLDAIYNSVYRKNQTSLSSNTIAEYKRRILRVIDDYEKYGVDPTKMSTWTPVQRKAVTKVKKNNETVIPQREDEKPVQESSGTMTMNRFELNLRPGIKAIILTPSDLKLEEAKRIKKYIEYLEEVSIV